MFEKIRGPLRRWPLRTCGAIAFVALVIGAAIGAAGPSVEASDLKSENAGLRRDLATTQENLDIVNDDYDNAAEELIDLENQVNEIGDLEARRRELSRRIAGLEQVRDLQVRRRQLSGEVAGLQERIRQEEAKLLAARSEVTKSSFGDGTWQSGRDFIPGTYQAPGGDGCYWAKLSSPSGDGIDNIIDNGGFNPNQIVSVDSAYFETSGCGTWKRTG